MTESQYFNYEEAFSRNIGWVTNWEQQILRSKRVAIAGMGGVGGGYVLGLARMGIGHFHLSDYDKFELPNFNRQAGAMVSTLGKQKVDVLAQMAQDINPELDIKKFGTGIDQNNLDEFLKDVDVFVDAIDAFVLDRRLFIYERCHQLGIPIIISGPLGMAAAYMVFLPGQMSFNDYFQINGLPPEKQSINFLLGLAPDLQHTTYLIDLTKVDLKNKRGPSTPMGCILCAGVVCTEVVKVILGRGKIYAAPWYRYFDPFLNKWYLKKMPGGNKNPIQRLKSFIAYRQVCRENKSDFSSEEFTHFTQDEEIKNILDLAKWSPSAENIQPWKFTIKNSDEVDIVIKDPYNPFIDDFFSLLNVGVFIETLRVAASKFNRDLHWQYKQISDKTHHLSVHLPKSTNITTSPLYPFIKVRSVNRDAYQTKPIDYRHKLVLTSSLSSNLEIEWFETWQERLTFAKLCTLGTHIRLSIKEGFDANSECLDFTNKFSHDKMPLASLGLSIITQNLIRWAMKDYKRVEALNKYLFGATLPCFELDLWPGLNSAGYFTLTWKDLPSKENKCSAILEVGQSIQRFWLQATQCGIAMHPVSSGLIFAKFGKENAPFTKEQHALKKAKKLAKQFEQILPLDRLVFVGRIGYPKSLLIKSRAIRKPLSEVLMRS